MRRSSVLVLLLCLLALPHGRAQADTPNTKRLVEVPIADAPAYAKVALVIGIDQYELCNPLGGSCAADAKAFASLLQTRFGFTNVVLMTDDSPNPALRPTATHLKRALQTLYSGLTPGESEVVVFYSGHGTRDTSGSSDRDYLVPSDGDPKDVPGTCLDYEAIRSKIETKNPRRALIITDACRDLLGAKGVTSTAKGFGGAGKTAVADPQIAELRSCKPGETSRTANPQAEETFTGSVFTHYLILGLSGDPAAAAPGTTQVTFDSLSRYIKGNVHQYVAREFNDEQTPTGLATLGAMMLARTTPVPLNPQAIANARLLNLWIDQNNQLRPTSSAVTPEAVQRALDGGANVNARTNNGWTALMLTAELGPNQIMPLLIARGADINLQKSDGISALMIASANGNTDGVNLLLSRGARPNAQSAALWTPLIFAADKNHVDIVRLLLDKGADVNIQRSDGQTALMMAAQTGRIGLLNLLLAHNAQTAPQAKDGFTALMSAAQNDHIDSVRALLDKGANVNQQKPDGVTALMVAAYADYPDIVRLLLEKGANPGLRDLKNHWTARQVAVNQGHQDIVDLMKSMRVKE